MKTVSEAWERAHARDANSRPWIQSWALPAPEERQAGAPPVPRGLRLAWAGPCGGLTARERRAREFALGRFVARAALGQATVFGREAFSGEEGGPGPRLSGASEAALTRGPRGEVLWPAGSTGAISHAGGMAVALVGPRASFGGLGVDLESVPRFRNPALARRVLTPGEGEAWQHRGKNMTELAVAFSLKESIYKALAPLLASWIGFQDAEICWPEIPLPPRGVLGWRLRRGRLRLQGAGWYRVQNQWVLTMVALPAPSAFLPEGERGACAGLAGNQSVPA